MKGLTGELRDLKDWTAYLIDLLSRGKRDVTALKVLIVLALIVVPGGLLLQLSGDVFNGATAVLSPMSSLFHGLISGPASGTTPDDLTHTGVFDPNFKPTPYVWQGRTDTPSGNPQGNVTPTPTTVPGSRANDTSTPSPTQAPTPNITPTPTNGPTPTPGPTDTPTPTPTPPVANFDGSQTSITVGDTVTFTDRSINAPTAWQWDFGDGTANSTLQNPTHTYTVAGDYTVTLTASNTGGSSTATVSGYIHVSAAPTPTPAPVAGFTALPTSGTEPLTVAFTDTSTGVITSYDWDFGDGSHDSNPNPATHTYAAADMYTVTLTVIGPGGTNQYSMPINVVGAPHAAYSYAIDGGDPLTVNFDGSGSSNAVSWSWDFGDSTSGSGLTTSHPFASSGTYRVTLIVTNSMGATDAIYYDITV